MSSKLRNNFDYIFLHSDNNLSNQKTIFKYYCGVFPNFVSFEQVFTQLTSDGGAMCLIAKDKHSDFLNKVTYYKP
jgi:hypothetical protein